MNETKLRILSAIGLVAIYLVMIFHSGWFYLELIAFAILATYAGLKELYAFCTREDSKPFFLTGFAYSTIILLVYYLQFLGLQFEVSPPSQLVKLSLALREGFHPIPLVLMVFSIHVWVLQILKRPLDGALFSATATIFGALYLALPMGTFFLLRAEPQGAYLIFYVSTVTFISDAGAYFGGRWFGKHSAGLKISPKKTWEGYIVGNLSGILSVVILNYLWMYFTKETSLPFVWWESLVLAFFVSIVSVMGDLAESAMKRDAKIKDSGGLIPGHGGLLDLADALLFTIPVTYLYLKLKIVFLSSV